MSYCNKQAKCPARVVIAVRLPCFAETAGAAASELNRSSASASVQRSTNPLTPESSSSQLVSALRCCETLPSSLTIPPSLIVTALGVTYQPKVPILDLSSSFSNDTDLSSTSALGTIPRRNLS